MVNKQWDAIVIGAGITGLVTAYWLHKAGKEVLVLEEQPFTGGVMRSEQKAGFLLEWGPNSFQETPETQKLIESLGISTDLVTGDAKMPRYVYLNRQLQAVPMSPPALIKSSLLTWRGKLRLLAEPFIGANTPGQEESIADFARRRLGKQIHDRLLSPFFSGVYAGNTERLSLPACFPSLAEWETNYGSLLKGAIKSARAAKQKAQTPTIKRLCSFKTGMGNLPQALTKALSDAILTNCQINSIKAGAEGDYQVEFSQQGSQTISTKQLVLATPTSATAKLLSTLIPKVVQPLSEIEYASMVIVHTTLALNQLPKPLTGFGFLVPRTEKIRLLGTIWNSSLFPDRAPTGEFLMTTFIGGAHDPEAITLSDAQLTEIVTNELASILGIKPKVVNIYRLAKAIPQYNLGHLARREQLEQLIKQCPGIYLVGNYLRGVSVPDCIARGEQLANKISEKKN